jgi:hypothetical protein
MGRKEEGRHMGKGRLCKGRGGYVREGKYRRYVNGYTNCLGNRLWITTHLQMDTIGTHGEFQNINTKLYNCGYCNGFITNGSDT